MARQIQGYLFDSPLDGALQGEKKIMLHHFFSLDSRKRMETITYRDGPVSIEVSPGAKGLPTMFDKELLLYICGLIAEKAQREGIENLNDLLEITFAPHDFFKKTGKAGDKVVDGGSQYRRIPESLFRLRSATVRANFSGDDEGLEWGTGWIYDYKFSYRKLARRLGGPGVDADAALQFEADDGTDEGDAPAEGRPEDFRKVKVVKVKVADWLRDLVLKDATLHSYTDEYFQLSTFQRRMWEIARAEISKGLGCRIRMDRLHIISGSELEIRRFKFNVAALEKADSLPDFLVRLVKPAGTKPRAAEWQVAFIDRRRALAQGEPAPSSLPLME